MGFATDYQPLAEALAGADHVDVKTAEFDGGGLAPAELLREAIAGCFGYQPAWITALYHVRRGFVRLLGMRQEGVPQAQRLHAADVPMAPGAKLGFFTVAAAEEGRHWLAGASESHLTARLGLVLEQAAGATRLHAVTIVHYHRWTGPVYFNVIRPFHHLVVAGMLRAGVRQVRARAARPSGGERQAA
ncbi:MAG TPA: DUF2867 domain-containing protein, partial [Herpetosiphonaceae bacterium]